MAELETLIAHAGAVLFGVEGAPALRGATIEAAACAVRERALLDAKAALTRGSNGRM